MAVAAAEWQQEIRRHNRHQAVAPLLLMARGRSGVWSFTVLTVDRLRQSVATEAVPPAHWTVRRPSLRRWGDWNSTTTADRATTVTTELVDLPPGIKMTAAFQDATETANRAVDPKQQQPQRQRMRMDSFSYFGSLLMPLV
jgi:hypothetical protein